MNLEGRQLNATLVPSLIAEPAVYEHDVTPSQEVSDENMDSSHNLDFKVPPEIGQQNLSEDVGPTNNIIPDVPATGERSSITYPDFNKNEGKLIFKITRFNKLTRKEKVITKTKRIISKCPHTSSKYYAKGMCKKCYHSYGREKKAFVCGHLDKPLYAKGYCKQCYLAKYKQQMTLKMSFKQPRMRRHKQSVSTNMSVQTGLSGVEPQKIVGDLYLDPDHALSQANLA